MAGPGKRARETPGKRNVVKTPDYTVTATTDKRRLPTMEMAYHASSCLPASMQRCLRSRD